jgi:hypothetical protein
MPPAFIFASFGCSVSNPAHVVRRVAGPALAADVRVEPAVAVGHDVEPGHFLLLQIHRQGVHVLLAEPRQHHRVQERARAQVSVYQLGRGSEPVMVVGMIFPAVAFSMNDRSSLRKAHVGAGF